MMRIYLCTYIDGQFSRLKNELCAHKYISACMCDDKWQHSLPNLHMEQGGLRLDVDIYILTKHLLPPYMYVHAYVHNQFSSPVYIHTKNTVKHSF